MKQGGRSDIQAVKDRLNMLDIVGRYLDLRPSGGGRWMAPCPFHQETKPSFSVNPDEGFYYCFGCQASGDIIDFFCRINGLEFREGLEQLAREAGVNLTRTAPNPQEKAERDFRRLCLDMYAKAADYYRESLRGQPGQTCREYLLGRGMEQGIIDRFGLGWSLPGWEGLKSFLRSRGHGEQEAARSGLLSQNDRGRVYDRFRERLMFPITNLSNQTIAFGGRILPGKDDDGPKYINSSDSPIYKKGEHLYGLFQARRAMTAKRQALLTEGYMDVLTLHQYGYENACGVLGTALTPEQVKRLGGFVSEVVLLFDGDNAGRKAALRASEMFLTRGLKARVVLLPEGEDVDSLLQEHGNAALDGLMDSAPDGLDFCLDAVRRAYSPSELVAWAADFLNGLEDPALMAYYPSRVASGLGLDEAGLRQAVKGHRGGPGGGSRGGGLGANRFQGNAASQQGRPRAGGPGQGPQGPGGMPGEQGGHQAAQQPTGGASRIVGQEKEILSFVLRYPEHGPLLEEKGAGFCMETEPAKRFWAKIREHRDDDLMSVLDDEEKTFWAQCRVLKPQMEEIHQTQLEQICQFLDLHTNKLSTRRYPEYLRTTKGGKEDFEVLRALQDKLGRTDG